MSSIMFQNNSDCSCNSCSSQQKYFEISKCFEELNTEIQKAQARYNLGIGDEQNLKWGNIKGFIEEQTDIIEYLNNYIADLNKLVAAIELVPDVTYNDFNIIYKTLDSNNEEIEESKQITLPIATPTSAGIMSKEDKAKLDEIQSLIPLMISGVKATVSCSPSIVEKNKDVILNINGTFSANVLADLNLYFNDAVIESGEGHTLQKSISTIISKDTQVKFTVKFMGITFSASSTVYARNVVIYGFGETVEEVYVNGIRASARLSAAGTYSASATVDSTKFFIFVPSDVSKVSTFTMGGAPFAMNTEVRQINNKEYTVFSSGSIYDSGALVTVKAE